MVAEIERGNGKNRYHFCKAWNPKKEIDQAKLLNFVSIQGDKFNLEQELKVTDGKNEIKPFFSKNGLKKFSTEKILFVQIVHSETGKKKAFKLFYSRNNNGTLVSRLHEFPKKRKNQNPKKVQDSISDPKAETGFRKEKQNKHEIIYDPIEARMKRKESGKHRETKNNPKKNTCSVKTIRIGTPFGKYPFLRTA
jgi:hypothetical protein